VKHGLVQSMLNKVSPKIAIISCGFYNTFGHPNKETIDKFKKINCIVYRTDFDKNIILISDGININKYKGN